MSDPFSIVHDHLWSLVEADTVLSGPTGLIKPGNRIKLKTHDPLKQAIADSDTPELLLRPIGGADNLLQVTSNQFELNPKFDWIISTGNYIICERLFPVTWQLFLVMAKFRQNMGVPQFAGAPFIKQVTITSHEAGDVRAESNRGLQGYVSLISFELMCRFNRSLLD